MIEETILKEYNAQKKDYSKEEVIFEEGEMARFYFQIESGEVKMCNFSEKGQEFIQGIFSAGRCFGEPPLFGDFGYPARAVALTDCTIWKVPKHRFMKMLTDYPEVHLKLTSSIASRLYYKSLMASEISNEDSSHRILKLLKYLKEEVYEMDEKEAFAVHLTRQQIASLTGLRVETTIRAIKKLEREGSLVIEKRRIFV